MLQTIGEDFAALRFFARKTRHGLPARAVLAQTAIVLVLLWNASFEHVLIATQFALVVCGLLVVGGVVVLRWREPALARPFRCWGYPVTPLLFAALACFTLVYTTLQEPGSAAIGASVLAAGFTLYFAGRWVRAQLG